MIFCEWAAFHAIGAALGRKVWMPYRNREVYPNLYILLAGPARIGKSTAVLGAKDFMQGLREPGVRIGADSVTKERLYVDMEKSKRAEHSVPGVDNPYIHSSYNITHTEFSVMVTKEDRPFMKALCQLYDCEKLFRHEIKTGTSSKIEAVFLNMIGGITDSDMQDLLPVRAFESGFVARLSVVHAEKKRKEKEKARIGSSRIDEKLDSTKKPLLLSGLQKIHDMAGPFDMETAAYDAFLEWFDEDGNNGEPRPTNMYFSSYCLARDIHMLKLCMLHSAAQGPERMVTMRHFLLAKDSLERAEEDMHKAFTFVGENKQLSAMERAYAVLIARKAKGQATPETMIREILCREIQAQYVKFCIDQMTKSGMMEKVSEDPPLYHPLSRKGTLVEEEIG